MIDLATTTGRKVTISDTALEEFRASVRGVIFHDGDEGYERARSVWNGMISTAIPA